jgi:DeoR/GlpR family transcriptional regulator of sugar metabolism
MKKTDLINELSALFKIEPTPLNIAHALEITTETVRRGWQEDITRHQLERVVGGIVRKGKKPTAEILAALREAK